MCIGWDRNDLSLPVTGDRGRSGLLIPDDPLRAPNPRSRLRHVELRISGGGHALHAVTVGRAVIRREHGQGSGFLLTGEEERGHAKA